MLIVSSNYIFVHLLDNKVFYTYIQIFFTNNGQSAQI